MKSTSTKWAKLINFMANLRKKVSLDMIKATLHAISKKVGLRFMKAKPFWNNFMNNQKSKAGLIGNRNFEIDASRRF